MLNMEAIWQQLANSSATVHRPLSAHAEAAPWSYCNLPLPHEWGSGHLTERVRRLTAVQLVVLHREWMQSNAMLLPSAEAMGPGSPAYEKVRRGEGALLARGCCGRLHCRGERMRRARHGLSSA